MAEPVSKDQQLSDPVHRRCAQCRDRPGPGGAEGWGGRSKGVGPLWGDENVLKSSVVMTAVL